MSRLDLQEKLLKRLYDMYHSARVTAQAHDGLGYAFYDGREKAFADCIRELEKAIEEAK